MFMTKFEEPIDGKECEQLQTFLRGDNAQFVSWFNDCWDMQNAVEEDLKLETFDQFSAVFNEIACTDWSKMTSDGENFGGPWNAPEESEEYKNASSLCMEDNAQALWKVAAVYTPDAVLYAVNYLCGYRAESVAQVRDLCAWVSARM